MNMKLGKFLPKQSLMIVIASFNLIGVASIAHASGVVRLTIQGQSSNGFLQGVDSCEEAKRSALGPLRNRCESELAGVIAGGPECTVTAQGEIAGGYRTNCTVECTLLCSTTGGSGSSDETQDTPQAQDGSNSLTSQQHAKLDRNLGIQPGVEDPRAAAEVAQAEKEGEQFDPSLTPTEKMMLHRLDLMDQAQRTVDSQQRQLNAGQLKKGQLRDAIWTMGTVLKAYAVGGTALGVCASRSLKQPFLYKVAGGSFLAGYVLTDVVANALPADAATMSDLYMTPKGYVDVFMKLPRKEQKAALKRDPKFAKWVKDLPKNIRLANQLTAQQRGCPTSPTAVHHNRVKTLHSPGKGSVADKGAGAAAAVAN